MQAVVFWKKWIKKLFIYGSIVFVLTCLAYANALQSAVVVQLNKEFSFVGKSCESVGVGSFETQQIGGAGYVLTDENGSYVAVGVYTSGMDAERVANSLQGDYNVMSISANDLYFTTKAQKKNAEIYQGAFRSLDGCMQVLSQEIARLESGATQQSSKRILNGLKRQFAYLSKTNEDVFPTFAFVCENAERGLEEIALDTVTAQKLRYLLCQWSVEYCQLAREFLP